MRLTRRFGFGTGAALAVCAAGAAVAAVAQQARLVAKDAAPADEFASSLSLSGDTALISAIGKNSQTGAAYVVDRKGEKWSLPVELVADDRAAGDTFGYAVALDGDTALVGAFGKNSGLGAAYVFTRAGKKWVQKAVLSVSGGPPGDGFGLAVALSGDTALITATDRVYVFTGGGAAWSQQGPPLVPVGGNPGDGFGSSLAIEGDTALIGAGQKNGGTGAAYVFARSGTAWTQQVQFDPSAGAQQRGFGASSVALSRNTALIGAANADSPAAAGAGAAYVYTRTGTTWAGQARLTASDAAAFDHFGTSVALDHDAAVVSAPNKDSGHGVVYEFTRDGAVWTQAQQLTAPDVGAVSFGAAVALDGGTAVVGAPGADATKGAAYVFMGLPAVPPSADITGDWSGYWSRSFTAFTTTGVKAENDPITMRIFQDHRTLTAVVSVTTATSGSYQVTLEGTIGNGFFWMSLPDPTTVAPFVLRGQVFVAKNGSIQLRGSGVGGSAGERDRIMSFGLTRKP